MKKNLKRYVYKQMKDVKVRHRTFCRTVRRVTVYSEVKYYVRYGAEGRPSLNRATKLYAVDPKPGDLSMVRVKRE